MTFAKNKLLDFLLGATFVCAIVVCITSLFPYFARKWWFFDLFSHFRVQMMLCLVLASVLLLFSTVKKTIGIFLLFIALHLVEIVPLYLEPSGLASTDKSNLSICLLNVNSSTGDPQKVLAYLQTVESDIIIIQEYSSRWTQPLEALKVRYPYQIEDIREDNFGMALLSKQEFLPMRFSPVWELNF
jgi:endonuclease/exonuclease/phosphatase (EEP) superfamily protein YafD